MDNRFNEKATEWSAKQGKEIPVWQTPKYIESRNKAVEMIDSKKYGLENSDFWILMNETKSGKMAYTGLIISHNGCLKINDSLASEMKFRPECVRENQLGYKNSLVFTYCCPEQGMFEVGEVNNENCKNAYPYAMAFKRCFDRVVLKNSKLAFSGVYSEAEADEFRGGIVDTESKQNASQAIVEPLKATPEQVERLARVYTGENLAKILQTNNISSLEDMTRVKATLLCKQLDRLGR